jgi:cell division septation protein DedD
MFGSRTDDLQDTEITLTTGKLLGIFFGLVVICSAFFTLGYVVGHANSGIEKTTDIVNPAPSTGTPSGKPSATNRTNTDSVPVSSPTPPPPAVVPAIQPQTTASSTPAAKPTVSAYTPASAPDVKPAGGGTYTGTYTVQVAAVSKQEDAQSLVSALQKKQYPVFVANLPGDSLFHVQVGPFSDPKEAEAMRARLAGEGYDAIVKK